MNRRPSVLLLAGLEPTGQAGLLADLEAVHAQGVEAVAIATELTAQSANIFVAEPVSKRILSRQIEAALELMSSPAVVKLGAVFDRGSLQLIRRLLPSNQGWWVVDPVVRTSKGGQLSKLLPRDYWALAGPKTVLTPNLEEARWLLPLKRAFDGPGKLEGAAWQLQEVGFGTVVIKGGHSGRRHCQRPKGEGVARAAADSND
jgi:hydroxymethylpyrimidine/phosphomethylpyrimidine kinase